METVTEPIHHDPSKIMQIGMGFMANKVLLAGVKLKLFTLLAQNKQMDGKMIKQATGFGATDRHLFDWLDALVALGFLQRQGLYENALYSNAFDTDVFLDKNKPSYIGGILEMANNRLYKFWGNLEEGFKTGEPQNETKGELNTGGFEELYKSPERLQEFMDAMSGIQTGNFMALAHKFDFGSYQKLVDVGGADGWLSIQLCLQYPNLECITYDLPQVEELANKKIAQFGSKPSHSICARQL